MLDTNSCIDFALARSERLRERIKASYSQGLSISTITLAELSVGARHESADLEDEKRLDAFVRVVKLREFDEKAAEAYGSIARSIGVRRKSFDHLIAAHAVSQELVLVTRNVKDFAHVPRLKVENWTA